MDYSIIVENELTTFTITLEDCEKANTNLYRIKKFDDSLCEKNIIYSLKVLKSEYWKTALILHMEKWRTI